MLVALLLFLVGLVIIVSNPILGLIPGLLLIVISVVVFVLAVLGRGYRRTRGHRLDEDVPGVHDEDPSCRQRLPLLQPPLRMSR